MDKLEEKMVNKKLNTRQSNIELLRIVAMIMIIAFHMSFTEKIMHTGSTEKKIFLIILSGLGLIGVDIIVIFTVYELLLVIVKFANIKYISGIFTSINSVFVLSLAVLIFGLFKNLHIKDSKIINYFGSVTLTAYLIHENYLSRDIFWKLMSENIKISNIDVINTFLEMIITVALIFAVSAILEPIRRIIEKQIFKLRYVNNGLQKIDENYIGNKTK